MMKYNIIVWGLLMVLMLVAGQAAACGVTINKVKPLCGMQVRGGR